VWIGWLAIILAAALIIVALAALFAAGPLL
jgi:hypothetical protein